MFLILFLLVVLLLFIFIGNKIKKSLQYWKEMEVPHVEPWMILGNMASVVFRKKSFPNLMQDLDAQFSNQRYYGFYQFLKPSLVIRDLDLVKQICVKDFDKFTDRTEFIPKESDPFWSRGLFAIEGKDWHGIRTTLSPAFTSSKMKGMFHLMTECATEFVNHLESHKSDLLTLEMKDALGKLTNDVIASCIFGFKCNSFTNPNNEFYVAAKKAFDVTGLMSFKMFCSSISPTLMKIFKVTMFGETEINFFRRIVMETIDYRNKTGLVRPDMIHLLKEAQKGKLSDGGENPEYSDVGTFKTDRTKKTIITDDDIVCQAVLFYFAGYDGVSSLLCNIVYELAINPDIQDKLIKEVDETLRKCNKKIAYEELISMKYLDMVVTETLRLWTPAFLLNRKCVQSITIEPKLPGEKPLRIECGLDITIPSFAIHRNPKYFPNPYKFDPERFSDENKNNIQPFTYLPFGTGPRFCIGNRFSIVEAKTVIFYLLARFRVVPVEKTSIPFVIAKSSVVLRHEHGYWLGLKHRSKIM